MARGEMWSKAGSIRVVVKTDPDPNPGQEGDQIVYAELWYAIGTGRTKQVVADYDEQDNPITQEMEITSTQRITSDDVRVAAAVVTEDAIEVAQRQAIEQVTDLYRSIGGKIERGLPTYEDSGYGDLLN
jgi:hypothetical protein